MDCTIGWITESGRNYRAPALLTIALFNLHKHIPHVLSVLYCHHSHLSSQNVRFWGVTILFTLLVLIFNTSPLLPWIRECKCSCCKDHNVTNLRRQLSSSSPHSGIHRLCQMTLTKVLWLFPVLSNMWTWLCSLSYCRLRISLKTTREHRKGDLYLGLLVEKKVSKCLTPVKRLR